jgi:predicted kinase
MILVRGLPGSGKSTVARLMVGYDYFNYETDKFWMVDGEYKFDITRIAEAHQWCQDEVRKCLTNGFSAIVSNTFTTKREMQPYFDMAREFGCEPQVVLCQGNFGNIHNVPYEVIERMAARFEYDIGELYGQSERVL